MIGHDQLLELRQLIVADLPLRYNDGRPVEQNMILAFERDFSKVTNGWRRSEGSHMVSFCDTYYNGLALHFERHERR